jgi:hypothetical protein
VSIRRSRLASRLRLSVSLALGDYPRLYYPIMRHHPRYRELLITDTTEIVVEGYPRSGNTFAVAALQFAQSRPLRIARHTHSPAQVLEAVRRKLPTLVLVRPPRDAAVSLVIREPAVTLERALQRYRRHHSRIYPSREGFVVGTFDEVTGDFGTVVERVNLAYGLALTPFVHTPANCDTVFRIVEDMERRDFDGELREHRVARPSDSRREPKAQLSEALGQSRYRLLLEECQALYDAFACHARGEAGAVPLGNSGE